MPRRNVMLVGSLFLSVGTFLCPDSGQASEPLIKRGDSVIVLHDTHVQMGTEKLAAAQVGTELVASDVQDDWVAVTVERQGKTITGWVHRDDLIADPEMAFAALAVRVASGVDWLTREDFSRIDRDADGWVTLNEFLTDAKRQTLDDLNEQLRRELVFHDEIAAPNQQTRFALDPRCLKSSRHSWLTLQILQPTRSVLLPHQAFQGLTTMPTLHVNLTFKSWKRKPFRHEAEQMAEDFLRTRDIRRSRVAQQLVDREDTDMRARKAQALFKWADKNRDGGLSFKEFKQALPRQEQHGDGGKDD